VGLTAQRGQDPGGGVLSFAFGGIVARGRSWCRLCLRLVCLADDVGQFVCEQVPTRLEDGLYVPRAK